LGTGTGFSSTAFTSVKPGSLFHGDGLVEVEAKLIVQFAVLLAEDEEAKSRQELGDHRDPSTARPKTRLIAEDSRSQVSTSLRSCFRPAAVSP